MARVAERRDEHAAAGHTPASPGGVDPMRLNTISGIRALGDSASRNRTPSAMSSGLIIASGSTELRAHSVIGVSTSPGQKAVTWIPAPSTSRCVAWLNPTTPAFVAEYTEIHPWPHLPATKPC